MIALFIKFSGIGILKSYDISCKFDLLQSAYQDKCPNTGRSFSLHTQPPESFPLFHDFQILPGIRIPSNPFIYCLKAFFCNCLRIDPLDFYLCMMRVSGNHEAPLRQRDRNREVLTYLTDQSGLPSVLFFPNVYFFLPFLPILLYPG